MSPNPTPLPPALGRSEAVRNHWCPMYAACLNQVVKAAWPDWTCSRCELNRQQSIPSAVAFAHSRPRE